LPAQNFSFPPCIYHASIAATNIPALLESVALEVANMKIQRPGHKAQNFGCCHTPEALFKYALEEGFIIGKAKCMTCSFEWEIIVDPKAVGGEAPKRKHFTLPDQPCLQCEALGIRLKILHKK